MIKFTELEKFVSDRLSIIGKCVAVIGSVGVVVNNYWGGIDGRYPVLQLVVTLIWLGVFFILFSYEDLAFEQTKVLGPGDLAVFKALSEIPLDIEGSNLANNAWLSSEADKKYMDEDSYEATVEEYKSCEAGVFFKNVFLQWDSYDCGNGYGCSHGSYVYEINVFSKGKNVVIDFTDGDCLEFYNEGKIARTPTIGASIYDFYRACQLCNIELEFSDHALSLMNSK